MGVRSELFGRESGSCHGRGGSMHIADPSLGIFGANGIVGAGVPIAVGAATAAAFRGRGQVAVAFFGDGAVSTGAFHEGATLAGSWQVPVVLLCENNQFSGFTPTASGAGGSAFEHRARAYGLGFARLDGKKTNRMVVAHEAVVDFGVGAEIAARAVDAGFWSLDAPVLRVGAPPTPAPYAPALEQAWVPADGQVEAAVRRLMST
jgi:TPP-dependent pyruvate/acetoin dehydrogenase alpha subunit